MVRIDKDILFKITNKNNERNIYTHPLSLARDIFWQRLEYAFLFIKDYAKKDMKVLDFGGGSGVFSKSLSEYFNKLTIIDLDTSDAEEIKKYFNINNVDILNENINNYISDDKFDLIIATDVLEHFKDLNEPLKFFNKHLKNNGMLLVTLPTENYLYEFGRLLINKKKPIDHYHKSKEVLDYLYNNGFIRIKKTYVPKYLIQIPLFEVVILKYIGNN